MKCNQILRISERALVVLVFVCPLIMTPKITQADNLMKGPPAFSGSTSKTESYQTSTAKLIGKGLIKAYSSIISPADGPRSPSYPTSTAYGQEAIERYGFFIGVILIADRLLHESDVHKGPIITLYGKDRYYDPVESNTFWWDKNCQAQ